MPRYKITAPDGREVTVEGPRPPTNEDAVKLFASLPPKSAAAPAIVIPEAGAEPASRGRELEGGILGEVGLPVTATSESFRGGGVVADILAEGGGGTAGQALGALTGPLAPALIPILGGTGAGFGNYAAQKRRIAAGEQDKIRIGELFSSIGTGAIPGAPLAASGARAVLREGAKQAAGGILAKNAQTIIDEGRMATPTEGVLSTFVPAAGGALAQRMQAANPEIQAAVAKAASVVKPVEQQSYEAGAKIGLKAATGDGRPPAVISNLLSHKNQRKINQAAAVDLGLPKTTELTRKVLDDIREESAAPYAEIKSIAKQAADKAADIRRTRFTASDPHERSIQMSDPKTVAELAPLDIQAAADIEGLRKAREEVKNGFRAWKQNGDTKALESAENALVLAKQIEDQIDAAAVSVGKSELVKQLADARQRIAKTYDYERALNTSSADISAPVLGQMLDRTPPRPLSGNAKAIADFNNAFPYATKEMASTMMPGLTRTEAMVTGMTLAGGVGSGLLAGHPIVGAVAGLAPLAGPIKRQLVLSDSYQKMFPKYEAPKIDATPDEIAAAIRLLSQAAGGNAEAAKLFATQGSMVPAN